MCVNVYDKLQSIKISFSSQEYMVDIPSSAMIVYKRGSQNLAFLQPIGSPRPWWLLSGRYFYSLATSVAVNVSTPPCGVVVSEGTEGTKIVADMGFGSGRLHVEGEEGRQAGIDEQ